MSPVSLVGHVGDAAGKPLRSMTCQEVKCADAVRVCETLPLCNTVELPMPNATTLNTLMQNLAKLKDDRSSSTTKRVNAKKKYAKIVKMMGQQPIAILRSDWVKWGANNSPDLDREVQRCRGIFSKAISSGISGLPTVDHKAWFNRHCDEYCAAKGDELPDFGLPPPPLRPEIVHCPARGTSMHVVTYQNGPTNWLCSYLRTTYYAGVPVIVLGWHPHDFTRATNVFYFADRVYTYLRYLQACPSLEQDGTLIHLSDADELLQVAGDELEVRSKKLMSDTGAKAVLSAEPHCMPSKLGDASWLHADKKSPGLTKKAPRCLNTGNFLGYSAPLIDMLNQTCIPCEQGLKPDEIYHLYTRNYSAKVEDWIYSEQAKLMNIYLKRPASDTAWTLDFKQEIFHPNFWYNSGSDMVVEKDGRLRNIHTNSLSPFIHYNGNSKKTWKGAYSPRGLAHALKKRFEANSATGSANVADGFKRYVEQHVTLLSPLFEKQPASADFICSKGAVDD